MNAENVRQSTICAWLSITCSHASGTSLRAARSDLFVLVEPDANLSSYLRQHHSHHFHRVSRTQHHRRTCTDIIAVRFRTPLVVDTSGELTPEARSDAVLVASDSSCSLTSLPRYGTSSLLLIGHPSRTTLSTNLELQVRQDGNRVLCASRWRWICTQSRHG
jgi:hypothetical protein